jgi:hypothetical protein
MKLTPAAIQTLAAAKALEWGQAKGEVSGMKVEGQAVALTDAKKTLADVNAKAAPEPGMIDRWADKLDGVARKYQDKLGGTKVGHRAVALLSEDHEEVGKRVQVDVTFRDGHSEKVTIEVVDQETSALLNNISAATELLALTPVIGGGFSVLGALAATVGAKVSEWSGNPELSQALQKTALKQWVLAGVGFVPGLGHAAGILAAARDLKDKQTNWGAQVRVIA